MDLIKLPFDMGVKIMSACKEKGIELRTDKNGIMSFEFTQEELDQITELTIDPGTKGCLKGIEHLRNLKVLNITSPYRTYAYDNASITDEEITIISKLTSLTTLNISGQSKITWLNLDKLTNLEELTVIGNMSLNEVVGLDNLKKMKYLNIYGNKDLYEIPYIKELISSNDLDDLELDTLYYPEVSGLSGMLSKIISCKFVESDGSGHHKLSYNHGSMMQLHKKSLEIIRNIAQNARNNKERVTLVERYLAENITYDHDALERDDRLHMEDGSRRGLKMGTQSAYNGIMFGSCVCEGYSRSMVYLLKLLNIKARKVSCIAGKNKIVVNEDYHNDVTILNDSYHSILCVELNGDGAYYCDPCWDSTRWHQGDESLPYCLKSKKDILETHTLTLEERRVISDNNSTTSVDAAYIQNVISRVNTYGNNSSKK